jgi:hypothetical protein
MYGVQWDRILNWILDSKATSGIGVKITNVKNSTNYGNYKDNEILLANFNSGAKYLLYENGTLATEYSDVTTDKEVGACWLLTTGATEETRVKNIYDMAGNLYEATMEGLSTSYRINRGSYFYINGNASRTSNTSL